MLGACKLQDIDDFSSRTNTILTVPFIDDSVPFKRVLQLRTRTGYIVLSTVLNA